MGRHLRIRSKAYAWPGFEMFSLGTARGWTGVYKGLRLGKIRLD
jgi:hypothetical protein